MMKKQRGINMIELLIAMALGLGLVAGIGQLFVQSQKSFRLQTNTSDMTDDASFLLEVLAKSILQAGYTEDGQKQFLSTTNAVFSYSDIPNISFGDDNEYIRGSDHNTKGSQLVYRYKLSNLNELDTSICTSFTDFKNAASVGKTITVRMYKQYDSDINKFVFYCKPAVNNVPQDAQPLVSDVEKLEFRYGVRIKCYENKVTKLCEKIANSTNQYQSSKDTFFYTTASNVDLIDAETGKDNWTNIFAVKVFLVMCSADDNLVRVQKGYTIDGVDASPVPTDKRIYKTFSKTVFLRALSQ